MLMGKGELYPADPLIGIGKIVIERIGYFEANLPCKIRSNGKGAVITVITVTIEKLV
jgi:hypothetical protein